VRCLTALRRLQWAAALALVACAPTLPRPYLESRAAAERAYSAGRYEEAARHWLEAADAAGRRRDRAEALYRAGASYDRAGRHRQAAELYERLERDLPKSERAARAAFERARHEIERGDRDRGYAELERVMFAHARSGLAPRALRQILQRAEERGGPTEARAKLEALLPKLAQTPLAERALYARAELFEALGERGAARDQYLDVARRFPYPRGVLWDDALFHAARLEDELGNPARAIEHLQRMLAEQEPSHLQGSYEKPRYAEAQFRIAELYRDRLRDPKRARRAFRKVWDAHPTSLLKDDALWQEALLARRSGDVRAACSAFELLADELPESRFVPCGRLVCPTAPADPKRGCRSYIERAARGGSVASPR
jgi:tetratricopeptide (TPR) repeat protein